MRYLSTRGLEKGLSFNAVLAAGLARDGGLYVPETWPSLDPAAQSPAPYGDTALAVLKPYLGGDVAEGDFAAMIKAAYDAFDDPLIAPLRALGPDLWLMDLFYGPTLAFKDVAMRLLAQLFADLLRRQGRRATILGATSGDTGSAAIDAFAGLPGIDVFILYPHGRVSPVQRRQMTTPTAPNVHALAIEGTFDDCQALVKGLFSDLAFRDRMGLAGVNSINWVRIMPQIVYYVTAAARLGPRPVHFAVPSGNFGDVYAGYVAKRMGAALGELLVATNVNDILARFFATGSYRTGQVVATTSPSMDIQVASNFERLLFDLVDRDPEALKALMAQVAQDGGFDLAPDLLARARDDFSGARVEEAEVAAEIARTNRETGIVLDPHSAIAVAAARRRQAQGLKGPIVALATAHPAKFPEAVTQALGHAPIPPARLAAVMDKPERLTILAKDQTAIATYVENHVASS